MNTICLCMIVNNEEHCIERCLASVAPYINFWVINDNGSTDKTPEIITNFFKQKGIKGILNRDGWKGFAHNRSLVFQIAEKESTCDWMYVIDADDYLETPLFIPNYPPKADSFIINLQEGPNVMQTRQQLFRVGCEWGYAGAVHEYPYSRTFDGKKLRIGKTLQITVRASRGGSRNQDPLKYWKDAITMEKDLIRLKTIPKNKLPHWEKNLEARYYYYICQSWHDFGKYDNAIKWANERVQHVGFTEEVFRAYLLKARCMRRLSYPNDEIEAAIKECINYDKYRAEGYYEMIMFLVQLEKLQEAWEWIKPALKIKRPKDKLFIVEDFIYEFGAKKEASWVAQKLGYFFESYKISNDICETYSIEKQYRNWAYNIKHRNIPALLDNTTKYSENYKSIKCTGTFDNCKIAVNIELGSDDQINIATISSFISCTTDYIKIDAWCCIEPSPTLLTHFPFLQRGRAIGSLFTINLNYGYYFFHRCDLITVLSSFLIDSLKVDNTWAQKQLEKSIKKGNKKQIDKLKKVIAKDEEASNKLMGTLIGARPKILYLNRYGQDKLTYDELPDLFDTSASIIRKEEMKKLVEQSKSAAQSQVGKKGLQKRIKIETYDENDFSQKVVKVDAMTNNPHVEFAHGEELWSLERISCVNYKNINNS